MTTAPLRVLIAHCRYRHRGGEDAVADAEAGLLECNGHAVRRLTRDNREIDAIGHVALAAQTLWSLRTVRDLEREVRAFRPDVLHVHNTFPLLSPSIYWAAARAGVPVVQTLHNFRLLCAQAMLLKDGRVCERCVGRLPWRGVIGRCYRNSASESALLVGGIAVHRALGTYRDKATRYIALNEFCRRKFIEGGLPERRIVVKSNFVDLSYRPTDDRQGGLFVGRLATEKGIDVLAEALSRASGGTVDIVGCGPEQLRLEKCGRVRLRGWQAPETIYRYMRRAAYLVMPSIWYENFPRTLVEAFACGLPVIASRLGAMAELIDDGRTGLLFEPGSAAALVRCLQWAESHPREMRRLGENARREYERKYTPEINYRQLVEIYRDVIDEQRYARTAAS